MDRGAHLVIGGVVAFLIGYAINGFSLGPFLAVAIFGSIIGSLAPDIIEPAGHYTHRDFFHSKRILKYSVIPLLISFVVMFFVPVFDWVFFEFVFIHRGDTDFWSGVSGPNVWKLAEIVMQSRNKKAEKKPELYQTPSS